MCWKKINDIGQNAGLADTSEVNLLIAEAVGRDRAFILAHLDYRPGFFQYLKIRHYLRKRKNGLPVAQITGHKEFFGLNFMVDKHVLIPRPETELMVEEAIKEIRNQKTENSIILIDVGTGTGCIPISIMKTFPSLADPPLAEKHENPDVKSGPRPCVGAIAVDISRGALRMAKKNARQHGVDIKFFHGNLLEPIINNRDLSTIVHRPSTIIITANLPYLTAEQFKSESSIQREPRLALIADNNNGLSLYEKLFSQISRLLEIGNWKLKILVEIDPRQNEAAMELAEKYFPKSKIEIKKDLAGHDRLVLVEIQKN